MLLPTHRQFSRVLGIDDCINFDFVCGIKGSERERERRKEKKDNIKREGGRERKEGEDGKTKGREGREG